MHVSVLEQQLVPQAVLSAGQAQVVPSGLQPFAQQLVPHLVPLQQKSTPAADCMQVSVPAQQLLPQGVRPLVQAQPSSGRLLSLHPFTQQLFPQQLSLGWQHPRTPGQKFPLVVSSSISPRHLQCLPGLCCRSASVKQPYLQHVYAVPV